MATNDVFVALASPVRRRLLQISVAEHLNVLRDAGLVYDEVSGRHRSYRRLRGLAGSLMSAAAVAVTLCVGCASEPLGSAAPTTTTASHPDYPGGPMTQTVIVPNPEFTGGVEILRATLPANWSVIEASQSPATRALLATRPAGTSTYRSDSTSHSRARSTT